MESTNHNGKVLATLFYGLHLNTRGGGHFLLPTLQETLPCVANANKIKVTNSKCDVQL